MRAKATHALTSTADKLEVIGQPETLRRLVRLIDEAAKRVWLVSPYTSLDKLRNLTRSIQAAGKKGVVVSLVVREPDKSTRHTDQAVAALRDLVASGLKLYSLRDLHAKIYVSERHAILTSLNLLESSFNNSIEIGMWIPCDRAEFGEVRDFFSREIQQHMKPTTPDALLSIVVAPSSAGRTQKQHEAIAEAPPPRRSGRRKERRSSGRSERDEGFCIACGDSIPLNPDRPYCPDDYAEAQEGERENHCHLCGDEYAATLDKPLCKACFKSWPVEDEDAPY